VEKEPTAKDIRRIVWKIRFDRLRKWFGSKTGFTGKTLWDWLGLLIIPAVLGIGALLFNQAMRASDQEIATDQQREEALQNYFDKMAELLLQDGLLEKKESPDDPVVDVAQVRTVTTLRLLDLDRKDILFQFLRDANLADFLLVNASLAGADLKKANLSRINLSGADLSGANLNGANLRAADLSETYLWLVNLSAAQLVEADLRGADLREANLHWANLAGANLTGAKYNSQTKWPEDFDYANSGAIGPESNLSGVNLSGANLSKANLRWANLSQADLSQADLSQADLSQADLSQADLREADLSESGLREADLSGANLRETDLRGANLSKANLRGADLSGARYNSQTKWPEGFDYENSGAISDE
jgi:uncharacterized protein YjbI with pentapeptide repeats